MKAVFDSKPSSIYDDEISQHYQFPYRYLKIAKECLNDWIILRRTREGKGHLGYFATAKVIAIESDPHNFSMYYVRFSDFLSFTNIVPWTHNGQYAEELLRNVPKSQVGARLQGNAMRPISEEDFQNFIFKGIGSLSSDESINQVLGQILIEDPKISALNEPVGNDEYVRKIKTALTNQIIRSASFRRSVSNAYDDCCAITRLHLLDRDGNSEIQAAHIQAVSNNGPDVVQNGIALSATMHWLFDRYLISIDENYRLIISTEQIPKELIRILMRFGRQINLPKDKSDWPHQTYLKFHRNIFHIKNRK